MSTINIRQEPEYIIRIYMISSVMRNNSISCRDGYYKCTHTWLCKNLFFLWNCIYFEHA
jgi:hypothetical protein